MSMRPCFSITVLFIIGLKDLLITFRCLVEPKQKRKKTKIFVAPSGQLRNVLINFEKPNFSCGTQQNINLLRIRQRVLSSSIGPTPITLHDGFPSPFEM